MIKTVDNFIGNVSNNRTSKQIEKLKINGYICEIPKNYSNELNITFGQYIQNKNELFQLSDKEPNNEDLIFALSYYKDSKNNPIYSAQTGNYIGKFKYNNTTIDIRSRFSDTFLKRMLNFANDVFLDDVDISGQINNKSDLDYSKFIIYYMFIQKLEKAFLLGLPKAYTTINHHDMKVKGKIDINRFIKYDIPFKGKISSSSREQKEIQEIIDVLYKAIIIIDKESKKNSGISTKNIAHIKTHLKQHKSNKFVSNETITKAIKSKALNNPIFAPYKKVLEYAMFIIKASNLEEKKDAKEKTFGFLVNVADLFEIYLVKLLGYRMPDWEVKHDRENELTVYDKQFYSRHMYPDIVMKKDNTVMVFDAKYKRMTFRGKDNHGAGDLDRNDFFQINTYMTYYDKQDGLEVIAGGLLYPIEKEFNCRFNNEKLKTHSDNWFGNDKTQFIVDGIDLSKDNLTMEDILKSEDTFIERIKCLSNNN